MIDQYFTPLNIASLSLLGITKREKATVADFAIGDGSLLKALHFDAHTFIGVDLDKEVIKKLKKSHPKWKLHHGNFLEPDKGTINWLSKWQNKIDIITLNPPFSCRGSKYINVKIKDENLKCRTALAFVLTSLQYLKSSGVLVAILPLSSINSDTDQIILNYLRSHWDIEFGQRFDRNSFKGCSPNSIVLTIQQQNAKNENINIKPLRRPINLNVDIIRGSVHMHKTNSNGFYKVIHTTNLKHGVFDDSNMSYCNFNSKPVIGTFLCIPRVGLPNKEKLVIIENLEYGYILSDCVLALRCENKEQTYILQKFLLNNWELFEILYESTCAPYITLAQLSDFLEEFNITTNIVTSFTDYGSTSKINNSICVPYPR